MGWQSGTDTRRQLELSFDSEIEAITYAKSKNFNYEVIEPHERTPKSKSYAGNFMKPVVS